MGPRKALIVLAAVTALLACAGAAHAYTPPPATYGTVTEEMFITMDDGVRLAGTVAFPTVAGQKATNRPAIVTMTPYGKDLSGPGTSWSSRGFIEAVFDIRGAGASHGNLNENYFSPRESTDGAAVIDAIGHLPQANCRVGMVGGSYLGITQYMAAGQQPECIKAIVPSVAAADLYRDASYHGGMLSQFFGAQYLALQQNGTGLLSGPQDANEREDAFATKAEQLQSDSIAWDYLANTTDTQFYRDRSPIELADKIDVPTLIYDGWFDGFIRGAQEMWWALSPRTGAETRLWIDPVPHKGGPGLPYNPQGHPGPYDNFSAVRLEFLDKYLNGASPPVRKPVKLFVMGRNKYVEGDSYPLPGTDFQKLYLKPGGFSGSAPQAGEEMYFTNPLDGWTNTLARHGNMAVSPYLPLDQSLEDNEGLVWETEQLTAPLTVIGPLTLNLVASSTAPDTDWVVRVSDVAPDGKATLLTEGYLRASHRALDAAKSRPDRPYHPHTDPQPIEPGAWLDYAIEVWPTANDFLPGHRMRLHLTSNDTPNHTPGTFTVDRDDPSRLEARPHLPALNSIRYGEGGSSLLLPVVPSG